MRDDAMQQPKPTDPTEPMRVGRVCLPQRNAPHRAVSHALRCKGSVRYLDLAHQEMTWTWPLRTDSVHLLGAQAYSLLLAQSSVSALGTEGGDSDTSSSQLQSATSRQQCKESVARK